MFCNELKDQLDSARIPRTATHVHPVCAPGRDSAQPTLLVCPTVLGMERVNKCTSNKSCILNSVCSVKQNDLENKNRAADALLLKKKGADVTKSCYKRRASFKCTGTLKENSIKRFLNGMPKAHISTGTCWKPKALLKQCSKD